MLRLLFCVRSIRRLVNTESGTLHQLVHALPDSRPCTPSEDSRMNCRHHAIAASCDQVACHRSPVPCQSVRTGHSATTTAVANHHQKAIHVSTYESSTPSIATDRSFAVPSSSVFVCTIRRSATPSVDIPNTVRESLVIGVLSPCAVFYAPAVSLETSDKHLSDMQPRMVCTHAFLMVAVFSAYHIYYTSSLRRLSTIRCPIQ